MTRILVLNGPNLGALGRREPEIYGNASLDDIGRDLTARARELGVELRLEQSNSEAGLIDLIEAEATTADALIINPAALSHTSLALLDALRAFSGPVVEVHLSNVFNREPYRRVMLTAEAADAVILGLRADGYAVALDAVVRILGERAELGPT